ncbi:hypothetical protein [Brachybacterium sp. GPGPB12]|uniref:hypothetical protein n=1 Tax=Brachybacterium sp. GPGPB12 TaxID=3023517 RepID=UPI00313438A1
MPTDVPVPTDPSAPPADLALRGTAVLEQGLVPDALVLCAGERILWTGPADHAPAELLPGGHRVLEHDGLILPGLVDLHCHGGGGASFPDSEGAEEMLEAVLEHRQHGTTSLVASLVTADAATRARRSPSSPVSTATGRSPRSTSRAPSSPRPAAGRRTPPISRTETRRWCASSPRSPAVLSRR